MSEASASGTLSGREVLLVVGGGIAAYKSVALARELMRLGAKVECVLTEAAQRFVTGLSFAGVTGRPARTELWDESFAGEIHIALTERADVVVVAPATANLMARMAFGAANDLATSCLLCARGPVAVAPAMHTRMWEHPATRASVALLRERGVAVLGPVDGPLASGASGMGRMLEPERIAQGVAGLFVERDLAGLKVLVSAGGTHEPIDPVRFVGNRSSGRMGYALAANARERGATVTLVSGPSALPCPEGVELVRVRSAVEMREAIVPRAAEMDVVVMAAAVADYRPETAATEKIKKSAEVLELRLVKNPDILAELGATRTRAKPVLVGFAVETGDLVGYARGKLTRKRCDLIVANRAEDGFEGDFNRVVLVTAEGETALPLMPKTAVAGRILDLAKGMVGRG